MAAIDDLKAVVANVRAKITEVKSDIADLISKLPSEGGLTAAQVAELRSDLDALFVAAEDAADDHTP